MTNQIDPVDERVQPDQPSVLPDWMRDPPPPKVTLGRRLSRALTGLRWVTWLRERWWAWSGRRRLSDRYPKTVKIGAFFLAWALSVGLIMAAYGCYGISQG